MANLFLTPYCDRGCTFCFAREGPWSCDYPARDLTMEEVEESVVAWRRSQRRDVGIVGGEPFYYSSLTKVVRLLWDNSLGAKIFTSGSCPIPEDLSRMEINGRLKFIVNVDRWDTYTEKRKENLDFFFKSFGKKVSLSYTMCDFDGAPGFLFDYINNYDLSRSIRFGIALPIAGRKNVFLPVESYREAGKWIVDFAKQAARQNVFVGTDCGFVACMFTPDEIGLLLRLGVDLRFICQPAMDIGPELEIWHCLAVAKLRRVSLRNCGEIHKADEQLRELAEKARELYGYGIYPRCKNCRYRLRGQCCGGCLGYILPDLDTVENTLTGSGERKK